MKASRHTVLLVTLCTLMLAAPALLLAKDWAQWRGPLSNGHATGAVADDGSMPPLQFGNAQNVIWKTDLPGRGHGSPTVVGNRIYLATADETKKTQSMLAIERSTGKIVWNTQLAASGELPEIHNKNTHASATVACDGERLFVTLYTGNAVWLHCVSVDGDQLWEKQLAKFRPKYPFGYAASPILYKNLVIATSESEAANIIIAYDRASGKKIWRANRLQNSSYSSPSILNVGGRVQMLISGNREIRSYDPDTGKDLWNAPAAAKHTCGTVTGEGNFVIASGGYPQSETTCIAADGSGRVLWKNNQKSYEQSMLIHDGHIYTLTDKGVAFCWDLQTGKERWKQRLAGPVSASPVLVGDRIYAANEKGQVFVFLATPDRYVELARNQVGSDIFPTPTFLDGRIYARVGIQNSQSRKETLYCFGEK